MRDITKILVALVRSVIKAEPLDEKTISEIIPEILEELYTLSNHHDVTHFVSDALYKNGLMSNETDVAGMFKSAQFSALTRYARLEQEQQQIYKIFSDENIPFVPLKGAVERTEVSNSMGYLLKRLFMKKSDLQITYSLLKKYSVLFPYYTVKRWFGLLNSKRQSRIVSELKTNLLVTDQEISGVSELLRWLGLN